MKREKKQQNEVYDYLVNNGSITALQAINLFGVYRLSNVIYQLKKRGFNIDTNIICVNGKHFARYSLSRHEF